MASLISAAILLCYGLVVLVWITIVKVMMGSFDTKSHTNKINLDSVKAEDNYYTVQAAKAHAEAAVAEQKAAEANLEAERIRSQRQEV